MTRPVFLPQSLDEALGLLADQPQARPYWGGTDLLVQMRAGRIDPPALVCLERLPEPQILRDLGSDLYLGAGLTHAALLASPVVGRHLPILAKALAGLGSPPIRRMGTIGGNICAASPAGDTLPPLYCLDAELDLHSAGGNRSIKLRDFILGPGHTALAQGELLVGIKVPKADAYNVQYFEKVGRRQALAIALVSLAAMLCLGPDGLIQNARLAWGSVGPTVIASPEVDAALVGRPLTLETLNDLAALAQQTVRPIDDMRASARYRRTVAGNLVHRLTAAPRLAQ